MMMVMTLVIDLMKTVVMVVGESVFFCYFVIVEL